MPATKNLCAQIPTDLHQRVCEAREQAGLTTAQYITNLLTEYFKIKENGGNETMTNGKPRTLAFHIEDTLFQRIKAHLERETARTGRKYTHREFILGLIENALSEAEQQDQEASDEAMNSAQEEPEMEPDEEPDKDPSGGSNG